MRFGAAMSNDIQAMTAQLAGDSASLVFLDLGEALRCRRQLDAAAKVARAGLARYPDLADAHDLHARILADRGDTGAASGAWRAALRLDPGHPGANKGIAFLLYREGDAATALAHLERAALLLPNDAGIRAAMARVGESLATPLRFTLSEEPSVETAMVDPAIFEQLEGADTGLLLLDAQGMRLAGGVRDAGGADVGDTVAEHLAGVSREAARAARLLGLGSWLSVAAESPDGSLYLLAPTEDTVLLTLRPAGIPAGRVALGAERAARAARAWLERLA